MTDLLENQSGNEIEASTKPKKQALWVICPKDNWLGPGRTVIYPTRGNVREVNGFFLFELGQVALLTALPTNADLRPSLPVISGILKHLDDFVGQQVNKDDLPDAFDAAQELVKQLRGLIVKNPFPSLDDSEKRTLNYMLLTFRDRFSVNIGKLYTYVLEDKGGRSIKNLWLKPLSLLDDVVIPHLSDFVKTNIAEAAKCWVVDRPTAVGFHMMRSVECVLRVYKKLVTAKDAQWIDKRGTVHYDGFGALITDLTSELEAVKRARAQFGQLALIIGILQPLSKLYRDPLAHPELKELGEEDAKLAFEQGLTAIARMVRDSLAGGPHLKVPWTQGAQF